MKSFYSILYVPIKPEARELLSIGLLMLIGNRPVFKYSLKKLEVLKRLLPKPAFELLKISLKQIEKAAKEAANTDKLFTPLDKKFSFEYLDYLSRYSHNLLTFSKPEFISESNDSSVFQRLFEKMVFEGEFLQPVAEQQSKDMIYKYSSDLKSKVEDKVNWDYEVNQTLVPSLIGPVNVDFIGKNGEFVTGEYINFEKAGGYLTNDIARYYMLIKTLLDDNKDSKGFIIGREPEKSKEAQHKIWSNVRGNPIMDFVDFDEQERIVQYINEKDVHPVIHSR